MHARRAAVEVLEGRSLLTPVAPVYGSNPIASHTLYLDFDGGEVRTWGDDSPGRIPAFDLDNDPGSFSPTEYDQIYEIWRRVAEDFAPFDLNVTTMYPGDSQLTTGRGVRVYFSGSADDWLKISGAIGVAHAGDFTRAGHPTAFVFTEDIYPTPAAIAAGGVPATSAVVTVTRRGTEAGHAFGLEHVKVTDSPWAQNLDLMTPNASSVNAVFPDVILVRHPGGASERLPGPEEASGDSRMPWAAVLQPGTLTITGSNSRDTVRVTRLSATGWTVTIAGTTPTPVVYSLDPGACGGGRLTEPVQLGRHRDHVHRPRRQRRLPGGRRHHRARDRPRGRRERHPLRRRRGRPSVRGRRRRQPLRAGGRRLPARRRRRPADSLYGGEGSDTFVAAGHYETEFEDRGDGRRRRITVWYLDGDRFEDFVAREDIRVEAR